MHEFCVGIASMSDGRTSNLGTLENPTDLRMAYLARYAPIQEEFNAPNEPDGDVLAYDREIGGTLREIGLNIHLLPEFSALLREFLEVELIFSSHGHEVILYVMNYSLPPQKTLEVIWRIRTAFGDQFNLFTRPN